MFQTKSVLNMTAHILCSITNLFPNILPFVR